jgi:predicted nucleotidyltransferase
VPHDDNLIEAVRLLHDSGARFVLVGGMALIAHGGDHYTQDIDISPVPDLENREVLAEFLRAHAARPLGFPAHSSFRVQADHLRLGRMRFLNLKTDLGSIDILPLPSGIDSFEGLWERSVELDLGGFTVHVASLDDLIAMKTAAGRVKDQLHLLELQALKRLLAEEG